MLSEVDQLMWFGGFLTSSFADVNIHNCK